MFAHRVPGVRAEVHDDLVDLDRISDGAATHRPIVLFHMNGWRQAGAEQAYRIAHNIGDANRPPFRVVSTAKGEDLLDQILRAPARL